MDQTQSRPDDEQSRLRVLIAGGGVAALEGFLALRAFAPERIDATLMAPDPEFRYRPLSVTEPFGLASARHLALGEVAVEHHAIFRRDALVGVNPELRQVTTASGAELGYDALLIAIGTQRKEAVPGAITFMDSADPGGVRGVLDELEQGAARRVVFAVPGGAAWPLGLYELALLTGARVEELGLENVELTLVTPESGPMQVFGPNASSAVRELLDRAGIVLRLESKPERFDDGRLVIDGADAIECDRVISLPEPVVARIPGLPQDRENFIPTDRYGGVLGLERVFAAGDATWFPVKQGGLAAQQADCAARSIAALAGAKVESQVFRPVLRGALLTGQGPAFMRAALGEPDTVAKSVLWWPPAKVAGEYLAPYLAAKAGYKLPSGPLTDLDRPAVGDVAADSGHEDTVRLALSSADLSADSRDFRGALRWLEVAEDLDLYLPGEYERKRIAWDELSKSE